MMPGYASKLGGDAILTPGLESPAFCFAARHGDMHGRYGCSNETQLLSPRTST